MTLDDSITFFDLLREKNLLQLEVSLRTRGVPEDQIEGVLEFASDEWAENRAKYIAFIHRADAAAHSDLIRDGATLQ